MLKMGFEKRQNNNCYEARKQRPNVAFPVMKLLSKSNLKNVKLNLHKFSS